MLQKIVVILGQTATGKSDLAVKIAKKFNGEIVSADSRQVYKGLNIGTGKITKSEMKGVPHHLINVDEPKNQFSIAEYKKLAESAISEIISRKRIPIICGGTGFYIQAIVDGIVLPEVKPNLKLRKELSKKSVSELYSILKKLDSRRAKEIDKNNPHRLIRAIEIVKALGKVPQKSAKQNKYEVLQIGIILPTEKLKEKIHIRLFARIRDGMIDEAKKLHKEGLPWKRMKSLGLEYKYLALYLQNKISKDKMLELLEIAIRQYAKRQNTWFKRDKRIRWFNPKDLKKIESKIKLYLKK